MSKIYDIAFQMGVLFNLLLFTILNVANFNVAENEYLNSGLVNFAPNNGFRWGFPFNRGENYSVIIEGGSILNIIAVILGSLLFGFLFRFVWSKISRHRANLK
jgi:hypothetical protein